VKNNCPCLKLTKQSQKTAYYVKTNSLKNVTTQKLTVVKKKKNSKIFYEVIPKRTPKNTGLFKMIVGVLTTCHTQYT